MFQRWSSLTFLHWRYVPALIAPLIPDQLVLDIYNGAALVGLTPFHLLHLRPPFVPSLPWISHFPETNIRTYVTGPDGVPGVWFFTLEAARLLAVAGARAWYRLPYRWARMSVRQISGRVEYKSRRNRLFGPGDTKIVVEPGGRLEAQNFDHFLTARYRLYTVSKRRLGFANIDHEPWLLQRARLIELQQNLIESSGVPPPTGEPILHYSADLFVRIGAIRWTS